MMLYKYSSIDTALKIIKGNSFLLNRIENVNDPFDCDFGILNYNLTYRDYPKIYKHFWKRRKTDGNYILLLNALKEGNNPTHISRFAKINVGINHRSTAGITCFSEEYNNILMWAHYTNETYNYCGKEGCGFSDISPSRSHSGVCMGFELEMKLENSLYFSEDGRKPQEYHLGKVKYNNYPEKLNYFEEYENSILHVVFVKAENWKYEKEWRIYSPLYQGLIHFKKKCLKKIYFGLTISGRQRCKIIQQVYKCGYDSVKFYDCFTNPGTLILETKECEEETIKKYVNSDVENWDDKPQPTHMRFE